MNVTIPMAWLRALDAHTSNDGTRYYLNGFVIQANAEGKIDLAATDGHRLIVYTVPDGQGTAPAAPVIVPSASYAPGMKTVHGVKKPLARKQPLYVTFRQEGAGQIQVIVHDGLDGADIPACVSVSVSVAPIDGTFPDYNRVIPARATSWPRGEIAMSAKPTANYGFPAFNPEYLGLYAKLGYRTIGLIPGARSRQLDVINGAEHVEGEADLSGPWRVLVRPTDDEVTAPVIVLMPLRF